MWTASAPTRPIFSCAPSRNWPTGCRRGGRPLVLPFAGLLSVRMANILVWGKTRDLISGEIPAGIGTEEVETLAAVQAVIEGKGSTLVLADPARLEAEKAALETWVRGGGNRRALI